MYSYCIQPPSMPMCHHLALKTSFKFNENNQNKKIIEQFYENNAAKQSLAELVEIIFPIACHEFDLALGTGEINKADIRSQIYDCLDILEMKLRQYCLLYIFLVPHAQTWK